MTEVIRSDGIEIKKKVIQQILLRGSGDSKFNNLINKSLKLLPPSLKESGVTLHIPITIGASILKLFLPKIILLEA